MVTQEELKIYALQVKEETGKFPLFSHWILKKGCPYSGKLVLSLFNNSYNDFREYCGENKINRNKTLTISDLQYNCFITDSNCWIWKSFKDKAGYGKTLFKGKKHYVHRVAYMLHNEVLIDSTIIIRHICNNKSCCNPLHLQKGTQKDNTNDRLQLSNYKSHSTKGHIRPPRAFSLNERTDFYLSHSICENSCLIPGNLKIKKQGYFQIQFNKKNYMLHRAILAKKLNLNYDAIDIARHICNNKNCINPEHLENGSRSENALDYVRNKNINGKS